MKSSELSGKTVAELKALAKRKRIALPADAKKADIIRALGRSGAAPNAASAEGTQRKTKAGTARKGKAGTGRKANAKAKSAVRGKTEAGKPVAKRSSAVKGTRNAVTRGEPLADQERIEDAKYVTGTRGRRTSGRRSLPEEYGEERITLMARDPDTVFAYWEVPLQRLEREKGRSRKGRLFVRVYDITGVRFDGTNATSVLDQEVHERVGSWYFDLRRPSHAFCADIGMRMPDGSFRTIARSNILIAPRAGISERVEAEGVLPEHQLQELFGFSADVPGEVTSERLQELLRLYQGSAITSPGAFSPGAQVRRNE